MQSGKVAKRFVALRFLLIGVTALCGAADGAAIQSGTSAESNAFSSQGPGASATFMMPKGATRTIDFTTDEGTLMSVDVSPDGKWIVFDLLGHVYRLPAGGGRAECLTQGSGIALNSHPRFSPDGQQVAFISDRSGQANVWIMRADGGTPHPVFLDPDHGYTLPVWTRDGESVLATRLAPTPGQGWHRRNASIWQFPLHGVPRPLLISTQTQYYVSSASADGHAVYLFSSSMGRKGGSIYEVGFKLQSFDLATERATDVVTQLSAAHAASSSTAAPASGPANPLPYESGGDLAKPAEINPVASPDGRYLAFARAQHDGVMTFRNHQYRHRTVLYVVDLKTGVEHKVLDPITKDFTNVHAHYSQMFLPSFAWTPDSREIVLALDGKIVRVSAEGSHVTNVPFQANVHRVVSGQVRRVAGLGPDDEIPVRFIQWPTASPDGRHLVFAALGRLWIMDLPSGEPKPLTGELGDSVQITPAWSPDGSRIAFGSWNERERGQIWTFDIAKKTLSRVSTDPGEYIWPTWSPDGTSIVAVRGPGAADEREAWIAWQGWQAVRFSGASPPVVLARVDGPLQPLQIGADGQRIYFTARVGQTVGQRLPYPDAVDFELGDWTMMSVDASGGAPRTHLSFPAGPAGESVPVLSPDGSWVAYQADYQIFAERVNVTPRFASLAHIDASPLDARPERKRADQLGGVYARWHDSHTVEFAAGDEYVTFDVATGVRHSVKIPLHFSRDRLHGAVALVNARIIPIEGDRVIAKGSIVARDGRIVCVGKCDTKGVEHVLDLSGKTVIPGLIDVHDHIAKEGSGVVPLRRSSSLLALAYGVTTIVDPAVPSNSLFPIGEMTESGRLLGPRVLGAADPVYGSVGGLDGTSASAWGPRLDLRSGADADYQVGRRAAWGAVTIKNYRMTSRQQQQWLVEAARAHGQSVTAEGDSLLVDLGMIMDGQTGWEHMFPAVPVYRDVSQFLGRAGANYSPTFSVAGFPDGAMFYYRPRFNLQKDPKYARFASAGWLENVTPRTSTPPAIEEFSFPIQAEAVADIVRAGGFATIGEHGEDPGMGSHWEMWAYATALKPLEVLRMATFNGARLVGIERDVGSLSAGKLADLVVLNSNPLERIESTADIAYVMKSGRLYNAENLTEVWPSTEKGNDTKH